VQAVVEDFDAGVERVTVWRTAAGREFKVRGLVNLPASGTLNIRDFEAGRGVESSYRVQQFDEDGDFHSWSPAETVTLSVNDPTVTYIHNPFDPQSTVAVRMLPEAARFLTRPVDVELYKVQRRTAAVAVFGTRGGLTRIPLDCTIETAADADKFDALFGGYDDETIPVLCIRAAPAMRLPATLFAVVRDPQQMPMDFSTGGTITDWRLTGDEVAPPAEAIVVTLLGYDDFTAFYTDYAEFTAAYVDYREAQLDYSIAGTA
jgi:hypothetical protein